MSVISSPEILCLYGSPRKGGNTDQLMDAFAEGVINAGGIANRVYIREKKIFPCREIYACKSHGKCALKDDMTEQYHLLRTVDGIALSAPVMFYGVPAIAKAYIDRCQAFWCIKYIRKERISEGRLKERRGVLLSVGGSKGQKIFDGIRLTFRYFLDTIDALPAGEVVRRQVDDKGDMQDHPDALAEAHALGEDMVKEIYKELERNPGEKK